MQCLAEWKADFESIVPAIKLQLLDDFFSVTMGMNNE